jgi:poly-gamma-glutamate capsule biosynthesis protein CapA/YwtB (metallophosphatase superfamily)
MTLAGDIRDHQARRRDAGRGIDQILPHPGNPGLREDHASDANAYVRLAERVNGPIPRPAGFSCPWGDALPVLKETAPDVRIINRETSVTRNADFDPGKAVRYRMNPGNLPCVAAIRPDVRALASNHVLDFGQRGLRETLATLAGAGLATAGAGLDAAACSSFLAGPHPAGSRRSGPPPPPGPG